MANRSSRSPGQLARFDMSAGVSTDVPAYAVNTGQAAEALAAVAGNLSNQLGQMADKARRREGLLAGAAYGQAMGAPYLQQQQAIGTVSGGPWTEQAKALIRKEEGFETQPYWDVNAHRVGYGSDTVVSADGKVSRVTQGTRVTRADAERDLDYRLTQREGRQAQRQLAGIWDGLPDGAKAGLASVAYNYGSLPKDVVAAARTGDVGAIANAVAALPANKKRRGREAALIRGGGVAPAAEVADQVVTGSTTPAGDGEKVAPVLSTEPLALRRDGTIYGEAFDDAAMSSWSWRMQEGVHSELFNAQLEHADDPQAFAAAAEGVRDKYLKELPNDPMVREAFEQTFQRNTRAYGMNIAARHEASLRQEQEASFAAGYSAMSVDLERQAQVLGANPEGDAVIGERVAAMHRSIDGARQQGIITPARAEQYKEELALAAASGRVQGVFESLKTPDEKQAYATGLLDEWARNEGPLRGLPRATVKALSNTLFSEAQRLMAAGTTASKAEQSVVKGLIKDDLASLEAAGTGVADLTETKVRETLGADAAAAWGAAREQATKVYQATAGLEGDNEDEIMARLDLLAPKGGAAGYADQEEVFAAATKRAELVLKERAKDPLGQAARAGLIELQSIDTTSPDGISQSLARRGQQRQVVADAYGFLPPMFTPQEAAALKAQMLSTDPGVQTAVMTQMDVLSGSDGILAVKQQFGDDVVSRLQDWQGRLRYMTPDEMTGWLKAKADPRWREQVKPLVEKAEKEARKDSFDDVVGALDENWIYELQGPVDADTKRMLMGDYAMLVGDRFASVEDMDKAKQQALERLRKVWGTSNAFGESGGRLMLYPPEMHYPAVGGSRQYIADELATIATARGVEPDNIALISDAKTEAAVDRGELPGYLISVVNPETGLDELATDDKGRLLRHFFDPRAAQAKAATDAEETRRTMNDPWLVLSDDSAIGPIYPFGAGKVELEQRARRIREINAERGERLDEKRRRREMLRRDGIPGEN